jgi:Ca2+-binding EF-hand superfamily protein
MDDPTIHCNSASQAWAFFGPDKENQVDRDTFYTKVKSLDILTQEETSGLLEYVDYGGSGSIDYDEWKAGLMMALASSGELHALPTEEEFNAVMYRIDAKLKSKGITPKKAFEMCDLDKSKGLTHEEFMQGMLKLQVGLSQKEITQMFFAMDADQGGTMDLEEFEDAILDGAEADTMRAVALPIFKQIGQALIQKACVEECQELATPVGSDNLSFDGFVQLVRFGLPDMSLSSVMRLWCIVDKCGMGGLGYANIPDLVANILASVSTAGKQKEPSSPRSPANSPKK